MAITITYPSIANYMYSGMQYIRPHVYLLLTEFIRDTTYAFLCDQIFPFMALPIITIPPS